MKPHSIIGAVIVSWVFSASGQVPHIPPDEVKIDGDQLRLAELRQGNAPQKAQTQAESTAESNNVETLQITSKVFNNTRTIRILLPPGYHDPKNASHRYPVLYFNDGITVFKSRTFFLEQRVERA